MAQRGLGHSLLIWFAFVSLYGVVTTSPTADAPSTAKDTSQECPANEFYTNCTLPYCYKDCKDLVTPPACPSVSADCYVPGCVCEDDWMRHENGTCVPMFQCNSTKCGVNEVDAEGCMDICATTCATRYSTRPRACPAICRLGGCNCKSGYLRNDNGTCVLPVDCTPPVCESDETFNRCGTACESSCDEPNPVCTRQCKVGCFCNPGTIRGPYGNCIKREECPPVVCGENQVDTTCKKLCPPPTCGNMYASPCFAPDVCEVGCDCIDGYYRNGTNIYNDACIPASECPAVQLECAEGEAYTECGTCEKTCDTYNRTDILCTADCKVGCFCEKGKIRGPNGSCIDPSQCFAEMTPEPQPECSEGEAYTNCSSCEKTCDTYNRTDIVCVAQCQVGCFCENGKVRGLDGTCIDPAQCNQQCKENEVYRRCKKTCPPQTCLSIFAKFSCLENSENSCTPGCDCIDGYLRNGTTADPCIQTDLCPGLPPLLTEPPTTTQVCESDETFNTCGTACESSCDKPNPVCTRQCKVGCFCNPGTIRGPYGNCIKKEECPPVVCGENQVNTTCKKLCPPPTCGNMYASPCFAPDVCEVGCDCMDGYYRNGTNIYNDACIPASECPAVQLECAEGEAYTECGTCEKTCKTYNRTDILCTADCKVGCFCEKGKIRGPNASCIDPSQCYTTTEPECSDGATYTECGTCEKTCDTYNRTDILCTTDCKVGCFCEKGKIRGPNGSCVEPSQCYHQCKENEVYRQCKKTCPPQTCLSIFAEFRCLENSENSCTPGCDCIDGYLRNGTTTDLCIPANLCPGLPSTEPSPTTPQCKENEVYNNCSITCPPQTCASIYSLYHCPLQDGSCTPGCDCISGYLRNGTTTDVCIPSEDCPSASSTDGPPPDTSPSTDCSDGEVYDYCGSNCPARCPSRYRELYACTQQCVLGCFCKSGTVRAGDGSCIDPSKCPPINKTVEPEEYTTESC